MTTASIALDHRGVSPDAHPGSKSATLGADSIAHRTPADSGQDARRRTGDDRTVATAASSFRALGTYVELRVAEVADSIDPTATARVEHLAREILAEVDATCSRFRVDSDLTRANRAAGTWVEVSPILVGMVQAALWAAGETDGLVDPCLGELLVAAGYDRTFAELQSTTEPTQLPAQRDRSAWRDLHVAPGRIRVPRGSALDLGAVGKGYAADLVALSIIERYAVPAVISVGGDVRVAEVPGIPMSWPVRIAPDLAALGDDAVAADIDLTTGAIATSSITARRWVRGGTQWHHVIDPRTARPTGGRWRSVTALAPSCAAANTYATAGLVLGEQAVPWFAAHGIPARLVGADGGIVTSPAWEFGVGERDTVMGGRAC